VIKDGVLKDMICLSIEVQKILPIFSPRRTILKPSHLLFTMRRVESPINTQSGLWQDVAGNAKAAENRQFLSG
jgi:hypothetical protein